MKRAIILAHFDKFNRIAPYVIYYLESLKPLASDLIFVSTAQLAESELKKIATIATKIIVRENRRYDFGSWQVGLQQLNLSDYDEVVICNDSVFGPLQPLDEVFRQMDNRSNCDFWGITNSYDMLEHIQSYFVVFKRNVLMSAAFSRFWNNIQDEPTKLQIVQKYEIGLTKTLRDAGFSYAVFVPYRRIWGLVAFAEAFMRKIGLGGKQQGKLVIDVNINKPILSYVSNVLYKFSKLAINPTHYCWRQTIRHKSPFIKVDLLKINQCNINIYDWECFLKKYTDYPLYLIRENLAKINL